MAKVAVGSARGSGRTWPASPISQCDGRLGRRRGRRLGRPSDLKTANAPAYGELNRHTLVTELSESGAGDEVIMSIAAHVSRAMLSRYSHVRMEARRRALDEVAARQRTADEKRLEEAERQQQVAASQAELVQ